MLFTLNTIIPVFLALKATQAVAAPAAEAHQVEIEYETITVLDQPVTIPTGVHLEAGTHTLPTIFGNQEAAGSTAVSLPNFGLSNVAIPTAIPTDLTTLSTVTTTAASVAGDDAEVTTAQAVTTSAATTSANQGGIFDSSVVHSGVATFYSVSADNCGTTSTDNDFVCAISQQLYNTVANSESISEYCGHMINITYGSKTIQVKVVDSCASCDSEHLDLSPAAFNSLANADLGVIDIKWSWA